MLPERKYSFDYNYEAIEKIAKEAFPELHTKEAIEKLMDVFAETSKSFEVRSATGEPLFTMEQATRKILRETEDDTLNIKSEYPDDKTHIIECELRGNHHKVDFAALQPFNGVKRSEHWVIFIQTVFGINNQMQRK